MPTSGSTDFTLTLSQIIEDAYEHISVVQEGETVDADRFTFAQRQLNVMIKLMAADGRHLFAMKQGTLPLVVGQKSYTIGPGGNLSITRPTKIHDPVFRSSTGYDRPIWLISRSNYWNQPNKDIQGKTTQVYYDPQLSLGVLYVWPAPDSASDSILFTYEQQIEDYDQTTDSMPVPVEWGEYLIWGLALRLCGRENVPLADRSFIIQMAKNAKDLLDGFDTENASIQFGVE